MKFNLSSIAADLLTIVKQVFGSKYRIIFTNILELSRDRDLIKKWLHLILGTIAIANLKLCMIQPLQ